MAPSNLIQALFLTFSFALTLSFAPQDVSQYCIDNALVPDYPQTVKPLMDSWSYQYLLEENGVWQSINLDQYPESVRMAGWFINVLYVYIKRSVYLLHCETTRTCIVVYTGILIYNHILYECTYCGISCICVQVVSRAYNKRGLVTAIVHA